MTHLLPPAASVQAGSIDFLLVLMHAMIGVLFAGWAVYFAWVLVRFRAARQPVASYRGARGRLAAAIEVLVVVAEGLVLLGFALPSWYANVSLSASPAASEALVIRVVAEQFVWNVRYAGPDGRFGETSPSLVTPLNPVGLDRSSPGGRDDVVELSVMHVPIDQPVIVQLSSKDVIHSFGIPAMRVKRDAIPGLLTPVWFTPIQLGDFDIACSQLCGLAHYRMRGVLTVESRADFDKWIAAESASQAQ